MPKIEKKVDLFTHILNKYATKVIRLGLSLQTHKPLAIKTQGLLGDKGSGIDYFPGVIFNKKVLEHKNVVSESNCVDIF